MNAVSGWARMRLLRWLGLENVDALVVGQRADHDALVTAVRELANLLNRTTRGASNVHFRLSEYERCVPAIAKIARAIAERRMRDVKRKMAEDALAAAPSDAAPSDGPTSELVATLSIGEGPECAEEMAVTSGA